jgi:nicotinate-nucleotide pyrophosphorylase (carboxylating)
MLEPLPQILFEPLVRAALAEDLGRLGDLTGNATIPPDRRWRAVLRTRKAGVAAGLEIAALAFRLLDPTGTITLHKADGAALQPSDILAEINGNARALLAAERTALNFLCHLSGIATATQSMVQAVSGTTTRICDSRKTTPGLRALEKYAVRCGGGVNHRFGLDDAVLIKDNHIAVAGGIVPVLAQVQDQLGHLVKIEIEVDRLEQVRELLALWDVGTVKRYGADISNASHIPRPASLVHSVLLDNMPLPDMAEAVQLIAGRWTTVASGNVTLERAAAIAAIGVDLIASGAITHSAPALDIGLDDL